MAPRLLDQALLTDLEARWRAQGAFVGRALRPGLSDQEMNALTAPLGIDLPAEARRWWGWHDGAEPQPPGPAGELGPARAFLPLVQAVRHCQDLRDVADFGVDDEWKAGWLPLDNNKRPTLIDCSVAYNDPVPVRSFFFEDPSAGADGVQSMGELVNLWLAAIERGVWVYDRDQDHWTTHIDRLDPELAAQHLV
jgi:cell wall assembly regulator SMI1